ncbi:hypothetical protein C0J52_03962 [Blattella germanica]|nr:hypothetical protein C0J52_03962 [Blattella germanica]
MAPVVTPSNISQAAVATTTASATTLIPANLDQQQTQQVPQQQSSHFVIQAPRAQGGSTATIVPVSVGGPGMPKHTFAYLGTIIKPGVGVGKPGETSQLVLPAAGLVPAANQKLLLAPVPVLPQLAPAPAPPGNASTTAGTQQPKVASLLVPMSIPAAVGGGKSGMINLKISNGQIHTEGKGSVTANSPAKDNEMDKSLSGDDEVTLIKVNPMKEESGVKEDVIKALPEDDVKIEIVKQDVKEETAVAGSTEDFDPMKVLEWNDGIGTLPGIVDDEDYEKLLSSKKHYDDVKTDKKEEKIDIENYDTKKDSVIKSIENETECAKVRISTVPNTTVPSNSTVTLTSSSTSSSGTTTSIKTPSLSEEENMSNDGSQDTTKRMPWQTGKSGFSWTKYLEHCKAKAAPVKLFKDPFPYTKNGFKVGMKMEGIDPEHPSFYCVLTVADVQGYRVRLHFDGYSGNYDFWVNADSMDIFPAGWCEKNGHRLHPPRGFTMATFNWSSYLKQCRAQAAPRNLFANKTGSSICPNGFRLGMKLEAVDRKNSSLVCVATVAELMDNRILVHFDSWDDIYDYWADPTSPYIHPVGWCEEHGHTLTPPNTRAFKQRPSSGFRRGMKLECVDKRVPMLIRVATVDDVGEHQIRIKFDGWPDMYSYWIDDDSTDIHPMGWCHKTGHPLEPPLTPEELVETPECPTPGCRGLGHIKGAKYLSHHTSVNCPYAAQNLDKDGHIPDRILNKGDVGKNPVGRPPKWRRTEMTEEAKSLSQDPDVKFVICNKPEGKNPVGRPPKWRRYENVEDPKSQDPDWKISDDDTSTIVPVPDTTLTCTSAPTTVTNTTTAPQSVAHASETLTYMDVGPLRQELRQSVMNPGYEVKPDRLSPQIWAKHSSYLNQYVQAVKSENPNSWTVDQVAQFVWSIPDCCQVAHHFKEQEIDGEALLMMAQHDLIEHMEMRLGPAIKLYNSIVLLRQRIRRS